MNKKWMNECILSYRIQTSVQSEMNDWENGCKMIINKPMNDYNVYYWNNTNYINILISIQTNRQAHVLLTSGVNNMFNFFLKSHSIHPIYSLNCCI